MMMIMMTPMMMMRTITHHRNLPGCIYNRSLGARWGWAPTSSWWPSGPALGPSGGPNRACLTLSFAPYLLLPVLSTHDIVVRLHVIYAVLSQNLFSPDLHVFVWRKKFTNKLCLWRKMTNMRYDELMMIIQLLEYAIPPRPRPRHKKSGSAGRD